VISCRKTKQTEQTPRTTANRQTHLRYCRRKTKECRPLWRQRHRRENNTKSQANAAVKWRTPLLLIPDVEGLNLGPENGCSPTGAKIFHNCYGPWGAGGGGGTTWNRARPILPTCHTFTLITRSSLNHSELQSLRYGCH
jgi:hypothetical protein